MELKLHRPQAACSRTGRPFTAGEPFFSALVRGQGRLERCDYAVTAWDGPPDNTLAWWRSTYPTATAAATLAPADVMLDVLEELEGSEADVALRYLVALELVRRRVLRFVDKPTEQPPGVADEQRPADAPPRAELTVSCRKRDREYRVWTASPQEAAAPGVEERLTALLWSGGAAA